MQFGLRLAVSQQHGTRLCVSEPHEGSETIVSAHFWASGVVREARYSSLEASLPRSMGLYRHTDCTYTFKLNFFEKVVPEVFC